MLRFKLVLIFMLALSACSQSSRIVDGSGVVYSEYYQCKLYSEERDYSLDALITLGKERLPDSYTLTARQKEFLKVPDTILEVTEVYINNHRTETITISDLRTWKTGLENEYSPETFSVEPGKWEKSDPILDVTSIYGPFTVPCKMQFSLNGIEQELSGSWRRLTVEELSH